MSSFDYKLLKGIELYCIKKKQIGVDILPRVILIMSQHVISIRDNFVYAYHRLKELTL